MVHNGIRQRKRNDEGPDMNSYNPKSPFGTVASNIGPKATFGTSTRAKTYCSKGHMREQLGAHSSAKYYSTRPEKKGPSHSFGGSSNSRTVAHQPEKSVRRLSIEDNDCRAFWVTAGNKSSTRAGPGSYGGPNSDKIQHASAAAPSIGRSKREASNYVSKGHERSRYGTESSDVFYYPNVPMTNGTKFALPRSKGSPLSTRESTRHGWLTSPRTLRADTFYATAGF